MDSIGKTILHFLQKNASQGELKALETEIDNPEGEKRLKDYFKLWVWSAQVHETTPQVSFEDTWKKILSGRRGKKNIRFMNIQKICRYAAIVVVLLNIGWWGAYSYYRREKTFEGKEFVVQASQTANSEIILPDSTKVCLREGSTLRYNSDFSFGSRNVFLDGEAYFDVYHNENHPFIVSTEYARIKVLGTKFNFFAVKGAPVYQATLVEGKVVFEVDGGKKYNLSPDQMIEMNVKDHHVKIANVKTELYTAWKDGKVIFRDETLGAIATKLERIYHVKFVFNNQQLARKYRFSGTFNKETSIGEVITMLKLSIPLEVRREERFPEPDIIYLR